MGYEYQPYPKMLYRNGEYRTADGYPMELELRAMGFGNGPDWVWPQPEAVVVEAPIVEAPTVDAVTPLAVDAPVVPVAPAKRGPGRPRKVVV